MAAIVPDDLRRRALLLTVAFTGLRSSELRGLRWKDTEFRAGVLNVRQRADRFNKIGAPKSETSVRTVPLDVLTLDALRAWKLKSPNSKPDDYVFGTRTGHIVSQDKMLDSLTFVMKDARLVDKEGRPSLAYTRSVTSSPPGVSMQRRAAAANCRLRKCRDYSGTAPSS